MATGSSSSSAPTSSARKVLIPKVWKRPHSTIYGKNVEYGNSLYSDKIGEIDSRKFNPERELATNGSKNSGYLSTSGSSQDTASQVDSIISRQRFDNMTDFDTELGIFVPARRAAANQSENKFRSSASSSSVDNDWNRAEPLTSIKPGSYRPNLTNNRAPVRVETESEEFEYQDKSSPFYTDRWAGRTIRHFDSDLYSNANLFKSMIL